MGLNKTKLVRTGPTEAFRFTFYDSAHPTYLGTKCELAKVDQIYVVQIQTATVLATRLSSRFLDQVH